MAEFFASIVEVQQEPDEDFFSIGFCEISGSAFDEGDRFLQFQVPLHNVPSDGSLNTFCLVGENQATAYGGIVHCQLLTTRVELSLDCQAMQEMGEETYRIHFRALTAEEFNGLEDAFERLFQTALFRYSRQLTSSPRSISWTVTPVASGRGPADSRTAEKDWP